MYICADTENIADGVGAKIRIVEKDDDGNDDFVAELNTSVQKGKIRCKWKVVYMADDDDTDSQQEMEEKGYTLPEYAFTVECDGAKSEESGQLDVRGWIKFSFGEKEAEMLKNCTFFLYSDYDNWKSNDVKLSNGKISFKEIPIFFKQTDCKLGLKI